MIDKNQIQTDITNASHRLIEAIKDFPPEQYASRPAPGAWSAAEIAEHLIIIGRGQSRILRKPARHTTERNPDEKIEEMKSVWSDFEVKVEAPEPVLPVGNIADIDEAIRQINTNTGAILEAVATEDMTLTTDIPNRLFGELTRMEWIYFAIYHTDRHIKQMERAKEALRNAA